ncbi:MAG: hypothetical protein JRJ23_01750, partial [Deltaproteobacteria bacterium]|nr:hypothetical protein [Deltaproteobacteria bacterium]
MKNINEFFKSLIHFFLIICPSILIVTGCVQTTQQQLYTMQEDALHNTTSREAYNRIKPILENLKSGTSVSKSGLTWNPQLIYANKILVGMIQSADGWIGNLSGEYMGAQYHFGQLYGREGQIIFGNHIYGYINSNMCVELKHIVITEADIINEDEFTKLQEQNTSDIGFIFDMTPENKKIFFKNLKINNAEPLKFDDIELAAGKPENLSENDLCGRRQKTTGLPVDE